GEARQGGPVESAILVGLFMPRHECHGAGVKAVGQRNAGERGGPARCCYSRHDFEVDTSFAKCLRFFGAAAEDVGVAALEAYDAQALSRCRYQDVLDGVLPIDMMFPKLRNTNTLRRRWCMIQNHWGHQLVI